MKIEEHKQLVLDIIEGVKSGEIGKVTTALSTISEDYAKIFESSFRFDNIVKQKPQQLH